MQKISTFSEAEQYLYDMPRFATKHTIEETKLFLKKIGNPDVGMKIIHVAGTNGKGSTCAYLDSILQKAGYSTALFTSPHLVSICERFRINGKNISEEDFLRIFLQVYNQLDWEIIESGGGYHPTYFEYIFFMAMLWFKEQEPDWVILEVGLGGLLDATNSVHHKEISVITRIGLDHMEYLGETIPEIAVQKAGIIMKDVPLVINGFVPEATQAIMAEAERIGAKSVEVVSETRVLNLCEKRSEEIAFFMLDGYYREVNLSLDTIAEYQIQNAAVAVKTIENLGLTEKVTKEILQEGLMSCHWAGRMEEILPEVFIDGAHNPDGIEAFIRTAAADGYEGRRCLLFGVVSDKNYEGMIRDLVESKLFGHIIITPFHSSRSMDAKTLSEIFTNLNYVNYSVADDPESGLEQLLSKKEAAGRAYITGSLYLVGEIKKILEKKND